MTAVLLVVRASRPLLRKDAGEESRVPAVAKGALSIGYGDAIDKAKARRYPAGSYVIVPGGSHHFDGAAEDTVIIGVAMGPWSTNYLDGSKPASAGTPVKAP